MGWVRLEILRSHRPPSLFSMGTVPEPVADTVWKTLGLPAKVKHTVSEHKLRKLQQDGYRLFVLSRTSHFHRPDGGRTTVGPTVITTEKIRETFEYSIERIKKEDYGLYDLSVRDIVDLRLPHLILARTVLNPNPSAETKFLAVADGVLVTAPLEIGEWGNVPSIPRRWVRLAVPTTKNSEMTVGYVNRSLMAGEFPAGGREEWLGSDQKKTAIRLLSPGSPYSDWQDIKRMMEGNEEIFWRLFATANDAAGLDDQREVSVLTPDRPSVLSGTAVANGTYVFQELRGRGDRKWENRWMVEMAILPKHGTVRAVLPTYAPYCMPIFTKAVQPGVAPDVVRVAHRAADVVDIPSVLTAGERIELRNSVCMNLPVPMPSDSGIYILKIRSELGVAPGRFGTNGGYPFNREPFLVVSVTVLDVAEPEVTVQVPAGSNALLDARPYLSKHVGWTSHSWSVPEGSAPRDDSTPYLQLVSHRSEADGTYVCRSAGERDRRLNVIFTVWTVRNCVRCLRRYRVLQNSKTACRWHFPLTDPRFGRGTRDCRLLDSLPGVYGGVKTAVTGRRLWNCCCSEITEQGCWTDVHSDAAAGPTRSDLLRMPYPRSGSAWMFNENTSAAARRLMEEEFVRGNYRNVLAMEVVFNAPTGSSLRGVLAMAGPDNRAAAERLLRAIPETDEARSAADVLAGMIPTAKFWTSGTPCYIGRRDKRLELKPSVPDPAVVLHKELKHLVELRTAYDRLVQRTGMNPAGWRAGLMEVVSRGRIPKPVAEREMAELLSRIRKGLRDTGDARNLFERYVLRVGPERVIIGKIERNLEGVSRALSSAFESVYRIGEGERIALMEEVQKILFNLHAMVTMLKEKIVFITDSETEVLKFRNEVRSAVLERHEGEISEILKNGETIGFAVGVLSISDRLSESMEKTKLLPPEDLIKRIVSDAESVALSMPGVNEIIDSELGSKYDVQRMIQETYTDLNPLADLDPYLKRKLPLVPQERALKSVLDKLQLVLQAQRTFFLTTIDVVSATVSAVVPDTATWELSSVFMPQLHQDVIVLYDRLQLAVDAAAVARLEGDVETLVSLRPGFDDYFRIRADALSLVRGAVDDVVTAASLFRYATDVAGLRSAADEGGKRLERAAKSIIEGRTDVSVDALVAKLRSWSKKVGNTVEIAERLRTEHPMMLTEKSPESVGRRAFWISFAALSVIVKSAEDIDAIARRIFPFVDAQTSYYRDGVAGIAMAVGRRKRILELGKVLAEIGDYKFERLDRENIARIKNLLAAKDVADELNETYRFYESAAGHPISAVSVLAAANLDESDRRFASVFSQSEA